MDSRGNSDSDSDDGLHFSYWINSASNFDLHTHSVLSDEDSVLFKLSLQDLPSYLDTALTRLGLKAKTDFIMWVHTLEYNPQLTPM